MTLGAASLLLKAVMLGEIKIEEDGIVWYHDLSSFIDEDTDPSDLASDDISEATETVFRTIPEEEFFIVDHWSDNDSCGFTIKKK